LALSAQPFHHKESSIMETKTPGDDDPSVKEQLLAPLFNFAATMRTVQAYRASQDPICRHMGGLVAHIVNTGDFMDLSFIFTRASGFWGTFTSPYQALRELTHTDNMLKCDALQNLQIQRLLRDALTWQDIRCYHDCDLDRTKTILSLGLSPAFMGYESVLQMAVHSTGTYQLAIAAGIEPVLTTSSADTMVPNDRLLAKRFPASVIVEYSTSFEGKARIDTHYTYSGMAREVYTQLF
jgi:hypothetical protein